MIERRAGLQDNSTMILPARGGKLVTLILAVFLCSGLAAAKDIAVVVSKASTVDSMALADLVKACKGQTNRWPDGKPVTVVTRDPGSPEMHLVLEKVYGVSKDEVAALITNANHNRVNHPAIVVVDSDEAVVKKVETTPGAIGLVDVYAITGAVQVLKIGGKLPLQPGYALHGN